jgi:hypothetical protein
MKQNRLDGERTRALAVLAANLDGCTRAIMLGYGCSLDVTASLIRTGLATDQVGKRARGRSLGGTRAHHGGGTAGSR